MPKPSRLEELWATAPQKQGQNADSSRKKCFCSFVEHFPLIFCRSYSGLICNFRNCKRKYCVPDDTRRLFSRLVTMEDSKEFQILCLHLHRFFLKAFETQKPISFYKVLRYTSVVLLIGWNGSLHVLLMF